MSHLGDLLSALVDGELDGAERDRAYAHLAGCDRCRAEAAELRALKQKLRTLIRGAPAEAAMTSRLIAMTGPGGPQPPRRGLLRGAPGPRPAGRGTLGPGMPRPRRARRRRYLVIGAMSLVVGLGTAAFTAGGGGEGAPGPKITPQVELYGVEHAINTGGLPFTGPADPSDPAGLSGSSGSSGQPVPIRSASSVTATATATATATTSATAP
jgi:anti-sigma factor RsiW